MSKRQFRSKTAYLGQPRDKGGRWAGKGSPRGKSNVAKIAGTAARSALVGLGGVSGAQVGVIAGLAVTRSATGAAVGGALGHTLGSRAGVAAGNSLFKPKTTPPILTNSAGSKAGKGTAGRSSSRKPAPALRAAGNRVR